MDFFSIVKFAGGLGLFLYGMSTLGSGLEKLSGGRLEKTIERLTNNVIKGVLLGALVTAAIQSSSATTVIVVGLVNARILNLKHAIGVIMGANIGTTVTAHILRLAQIDSGSFFLQLLKPTTLAPLAIILGVALFMFAKKNSKKQFGEMLLGFGVLFTGMSTMEGAVSALRELPAFADMFATFSNPIIGVLVGTIVTAIIQSSSASIGILQALSTTGIITYSSAFPIIMGQNIGTCITPILASVGASKNAKRSAFVHLTFNILGTAIFLTGTYALHYAFDFPFWDQPIDMGGIANFHTIFNVTITLLFIPFVSLLEKLAYRVIRDSDSDLAVDQSSINLDDRFLVSPGFAIEHVRTAVSEMGHGAKESYAMALALFDKFDPKEAATIEEIENAVDVLEDRVSSYLLKLSEKDLSEAEGRAVSLLMHMTNDFERVSDCAINIMECAQNLQKRSASFSEAALMEIKTLGAAVREIIDLSLEAYEKEDLEKAFTIEPLEEVIDLIEDTLRTRHIDRLRMGHCSVDAAFPFVEAISNMEKIADHCSNVGTQILSNNKHLSTLDRHEYLKSMHRGESDEYRKIYDNYEALYFKPISGEK